MNRRKFLKNSCIACMSAGAGISLLSLESCSSTQVLKSELDKGTITIDLSTIIDSNQPFLVRVKKLEHDILLVKKESGYTAIYLQCSHENNAVNYASHGLVCNAHGSKFDLTGKVKNGPAEKGLKCFTAKLENNKIIIDIDSGEI